MRVVVILSHGGEITHEDRALGIRAEGSELRVVALNRGIIVATVASYPEGTWKRAKLYRDKLRETKAPIYIPSRRKGKQFVH